jgi:multiple sugar transport system permease protein
MHRLLDNRNVLGLLFMLPAGALLLVFLTYPPGLGTWLGFTDAKIGRPGEWIGAENFIYLFGDSVARLSLFNTFFYTTVASILKFVLGLWLALLLNRNLPFKAFLRAIVLLPFIVPTALSAIAFWWLYDSQFSVISWTLTKMGIIHRYIDFLGEPWLARLSTIAANVWRGVPFVASRCSPDCKPSRLAL